MNTNDRKAPLKITRNEPEPEPIENNFDPEEAELQAQAEALEQRKQQLEDKKREAQEAEYNRQLDRYNSLREDAAGFRVSAAKETDESSKKTYLRWAIDADKEAVLLAQTLGLDIPEELQTEAEPPKVTERLGGKRKQVFFQMALLLGIIFIAYSSFVGYGEHLKELNEAIPNDRPDLKLQPYDATSIQKFYLEKFYEFFDLPLALVKLLVLAPFILVYALPFVRSRKDFITEFYEDLTPFQRCVLTVVLLSLFIFHSALSHLVKP